MYCFLQNCLLFLLFIYVKLLNIFRDYGKNIATRRDINIYWQRLISVYFNKCDSKFTFRYISITWDVLISYLKILYFSFIYFHVAYLKMGLLRYVSLSVFNKNLRFNFELSLNEKCQHIEYLFYMCFIQWQIISIVSQGYTYLI